jgi:hypothetical protein
MEDVLEVYQRPHDPDHPLVCVGESSKQLIKETRTPVAMRPGQSGRYHYEYERNGTANDVRPHWKTGGQSHRSARGMDYAHVLKELSDTRFPDAEKIVLVQDNLSTHTPAALYEAFPAGEARRLVERFEWHYTPKHNSWLNLPESELGVLSSQCLNRRMPDKRFLKSEVAGWQTNRNKKHTKANWKFTTQDARVKLKSLYPLVLITGTTRLTSLDAIP